MVRRSLPEVCLIWSLPRYWSAFTLHDFNANLHTSCIPELECLRLHSRRLKATMACPCIRSLSLGILRYLSPKSNDNAIVQYGDADALFASSN